MSKDAHGEYQALLRSRDFAVHPCDGFVTSVTRTSEDATVQLSFWIVDGTPPPRTMRSHTKMRLTISSPGASATCFKRQYGFGRMSRFRWR